MNIHEVLYKEKFRFKAITNNSSSDFNIIFLPGGPGLGSEIFVPWINNIQFENSNIWLCDFPGDGSNCNVDKNYNFCMWKKSLIMALSSFDNVILVAHSFSAMFTLMIPELEKILLGLILIGVTPDNKYQKKFPSLISKLNLVNVEKEKELFNQNKSNKNFKSFTMASWPLFMMKKSKNIALDLLGQLPYNYIPYDWAEKEFHPKYSASWIPCDTKVMILTGDNDILTPLEYIKSDERFNKKNIRIFEVKDAGHFPWIERPKKVKNLIKKFIDEV